MTSFSTNRANQRNALRIIGPRSRSGKQRCACQFAPPWPERLTRN
jgi:hypothetical protein